jgi:PKD repeat protein
MIPGQITGVITRIATLILAVAGLGLSCPGTALADVPSNDDFANATVISSLPFSDVADITTATTEVGEPTGGCGLVPKQTVWYTITPASNMAVQIDTTGSDFFDSLFFLYQQEGTGLGGLVSSTCPGQSGTFHLQAGTTYYVQAGSAGFSAGGTLHLNARQIPPPPNDNFANATAISPAALPFADTQIATSATTEPGEPVPACAPVRLLPNSWWYSFTVTSSGSFTARSTGGAAVIAAYTGTDLATLNQVGCAFGFHPMTFRAAPGTTYYLQVSDYSDVEFVPITVTVDDAPPPAANFSASPGDPSIFDTVQFTNQSSDPAGVGITEDHYNFGDGTTAAGCCPGQPGDIDTTHTYSKDGDYTVTDTVTTQDGRTATASQVIHIRTHDVAITKFTVPTSASAGQTRSITVGISDKRYPETVEVQLLKSNSQGGFDLVGTLTNFVAVQTGNSTAPFAFSYTYTPADTTARNVTFEAIATIQGARDALPADNTAIAATSVNRQQVSYR